MFAALKEAFTFTLVLAHQVPDAQIVVKADTFDYALGTILSIDSADSDIYFIAFYFYTFSALKLNYDVYNKELLAIFEVFKIW